MKKLFFLFAFMGLFTFAASAQTKACCASKSASSKSCSAKLDKAMIDKAASADKSIVKQVSDNGEVSYSRKEVDSSNGEVKLTAVEYCSKAEKFVNVSPTDGSKACCKKGEGTKVSSTDKKASCSKKEMKSCHAKGEKTSKVSSKEAKVKLVSETNDQ